MMTDFHYRVHGWANDRGILVNSSPSAQMLKLMEEAGELAESIRKCKSPIDDIGDCMVVLAILASMSGCTLSSCKYDSPIRGRNILRLMESMGRLAESIAKSKSPQEDIGACIASLISIASSSKLTLEECTDHAWNEIKYRAGYLNENGVFIKASE